MPPIDLGALFRSLRRSADLSQRELAAAAGVPPSTLARIESGQARDPRFRTVERLVRAAGAELLPPVQEHPDEDLIDGGDRHYPAHLDVRPVVVAEDWWGAWWAGIHVLPRSRWPKEAPERTFDLRRDRRDARRWRREARERVTETELQQVESWRWIARLADGTLLGFLVAAPHGECLELLHLEIDPDWRALGLGRRLLGALYEEAERAGISHVRVLVA